MLNDQPDIDNNTSSTYRLLSFVSELQMDECPKEALEMAKKCIIDVIGVIVAGRNEESSEKIKSYVTTLGSSGEATVLGSAERFSPPHAALINGVQGHALDFDDTSFYTFSLHPSVTIVPSLIAAGEVVDASGSDILAAYVAGFEAAIRIPGGIGGVLQEMGYHPTGTVGTFGATVGAGKLLNLNQEEFQHAMGIASSLYSGIIPNYGTMTKPLHAGLANQNGLKAAMLANKGFTANSAILDEPSGPWLQVNEEYEIDHWCTNLGEKWFTSKGIGIKIYPSCACTHGAIDAARQIHEELKSSQLEPKEIKSISVHAAQSARDQLKYDLPETKTEAKFSMPYCVSTAILDGDINLNHFKINEIQRSDIQNLSSKTVFQANKEYANEGYISEGYPAKVSVALSDGTKITKSVFEPSGTPLSPISDQKLREKFQDCVGEIVDEETTRSLYDQLENFENVGNINSITCRL